MSNPNWPDEFVQFCLELKAKQKQGRPSLRREWTALKSLFVERVLPHMSPVDVRELLGKEIEDLDPEDNDLKALASHAVGKGLIDPGQLRAALQDAEPESPLHFLATLSGKAFGESIATEICRYWLTEFGDGWDKRPGRDLYDVGWTPVEGLGTLRIELKASSEYPAFRFQQIRDPRIGIDDGLAYDALLCLGVTSSSIEFWIIPSEDLVVLLDEGSITNQHGGRKTGLTSNTNWIALRPAERIQLAEYHSAPGDLRNSAIKIISKPR